MSQLKVGGLGKGERMKKGSLHYPPESFAACPQAVVEFGLFRESSHSSMRGWASSKFLAGTQWVSPVSHLTR